MIRLWFANSSFTTSYLHRTIFYMSLNPMVLTSCREICLHKEAYVRRSVLFAASCVLLSLHPSYVATSLVEGNTDISNGLEWVRTWALRVTESDTDRECYSVSY